MTNISSEKIDIKQDKFLSNVNEKNTAFSKKLYFKNVGFNLKTPFDAINGNYVDKKCPFTGNISIRGRILKGTVISTKMNRSVIVRRDYLHYIPKYKRFEKRHRNIPCHCSPCFRVQEGDLVTIGQCRPLSKTIRFNVLRIDKQTIKAHKKN